MEIVLMAGAEPVAGYKLIKRLGRGGCGEVWKATGPGGFEVALKFVVLDGKVGEVELRALELFKTIRHPHLITLFGSWQVDGMLIVAMELAEGTLLDRLHDANDRGLAGIPEPEIFEYIREAAKGLDYLNDSRREGNKDSSQSIQHRDVKPQNLLLVGGSVKVADFGLALVLENTAAGHSGSHTVAYAAPEFFKGKVSSRSDQYSLAVSYCQLRGGRLPFTGRPDQIQAGHLSGKPELSMLSETERPAVARALAKSPEDRWPSCLAFLQAVRGETEPVPSGVGQIPGWRWHGGRRLIRKFTVTISIIFGYAPDTLVPGGQADPKPNHTVRWLGVAAVVLLLTLGLGLIWVWAPGREKAGLIPKEGLAKAAETDATPKPPVVATPPLPRSSVDARVEAGLAQISAAEYDRAIKEFNEALRLEPKSARALAGRSLARALVIYNGMPEFFEYLKLGAEDGAEALRLDPQLALAHLTPAFGLAFGPNANFPKALSEAEEAIRLDPKLALAQAAKANVLLTRGIRENAKSDFQAAKQYASLALHLDSGLALAYEIRGNAKRLLEDYDGALLDFDESTRINPDQPMNNVDRAMVFLAKGNPMRAINNLNRAINLAPKMLAAYRQRAIAYDSLGDNQKADADRREISRLTGGSGLRRKKTNE